MSERCRAFAEGLQKCFSFNYKTCKEKDFLHLLVPHSPGCDHISDNLNKHVYYVWGDKHILHIHNPCDLNRASPSQTFFTGRGCNPSLWSHVTHRSWVIHHVSPEQVQCMWDKDVAAGQVADGCLAGAIAMEVGQVLRWIQNEMVAVLLRAGSLCFV